MIIHRFIHCGSTWSPRERRLIGRGPKEAPPVLVVNEMIQEVREAVDEEKEQEAEKRAETLAERLPSLRGKLEEIDRKEVFGSLRDLATRASAKKFERLGQQLSHLSLEVMEQIPAEEVAKKPKVKEKEGWWAETKVNPMNWKPETRRTIAAVSGALFVTSMVYLIWNYGKKLWSGTKKGVEKTTSGVKSALKWTLGIGLLAGIGVLAFFGFKKGAEAMRQVKNTLEGAKKVAEKAQQIADRTSAEILKMTDHVEVLQTKALEASRQGQDEVAKVLEAQAAKLQEQVINLEEVRNRAQVEAEKALADVAAQASEDASRQDTPSGATPEGEPQSEAPSAGETSAEVPPSEEASAIVGGEQAREEEKTLREAPIELKAALEGLEMFYRNDAITTVFLKMKEKKMGEIWSQEVPRKHPYEVEPIFAEEDEKVERDEELPTEVQALIDATQDPFEAQKYYDAYVALISLSHRLEKHFRRVHEESGSDVPAEEVSFEEFVMTTGRGARYTLKFYQILESSGGTLKNFDRVEMAKVLTGELENLPLLRGTEALPENTRLMLALRAAETRGDQEEIVHIKRLESLLRTVTLRQLLEYLAGPGKVRAGEHVRGIVSDEPPEDDLEFCLWGICKYGLPTSQRYLRFFHGVLPNHEWDTEDEKKNEAVAEGFLQSMTASEALRLYLYDTLMRSDNELEVATGVSLMQSETLLFVRKEDKSYGDRLHPDFYKVSYILACKMQDPEAVREFLDELEIPEDMQEQVTNAFLKLKDSALSLGWYAMMMPFRETFSAVAAGVEEHPIAGTAIGLGAASVGLFGVKGTLDIAKTGGLRLPVYLSRTRYEPRAVAKALERTAFWYEGGWKRTLWARGVEPATAAAPRLSAFRHINTMVGEIDLVGGDMAKRLNGQLRRCMYGATPQRWTAFIDDVDGVIRGVKGGPEALEQIATQGTRPYFPGGERGTLNHLLNLRDSAVDFSTNVNLRQARMALQHRQTMLLMKAPPRLTARIPESVAKLILEQQGLPSQLWNNKAARAVLCAKDSEVSARSMRAAYQVHGMGGAKRAARYLLEVGDDAIPALRTDKVMNVIASGKAGNPASIGRFMRRASVTGGLAKGGQEITEEVCLRTIEKMTHWQKAGVGMRLLQLGGLAFEAGIVGLDLWFAYKSAERTKKVTEQIKEELLDIGFKTKQGEGGKEVYESPDHSITITVEDLENLTDTQVSEYLAKAAVDTTIMAGTAYLIFCSSATLSGGATLVLVGAIVTIHYSIDYISSAVEESKHREFLAKCPAWLLASLGTQTFVEKDPYAVMDTYPAGMTRAEVVEGMSRSLASADSADYGVGAPSERTHARDREDVEKEKEQIRDKALQVLCVHSLASAYPDLYKEMLVLLHGLDLQDVDNGAKGILATDGWFLCPGGAYEKIAKPYVAMRMFADRADEKPFKVSAGLNVPPLAEGDRFLSSLLYLGDPLSYEEQTRKLKRERLGESALRAMVLCLNDLRKKWHESQLRNIEEEYQRDLTEDPDDNYSSLKKEARLEELEEFLTLHRRSFGVFGQHPSSVPESKNDVSFVEQMVQDRYVIVEGGPPELQYERARSGWGIAPNDEAGMSIWDFEKKYLRPDRYSASVELRLKEQNEELFQKYEGIVNDRELKEMLGYECYPLKSFARDVQLAGQEEELKRLSQDERLDRYLAFDRPFHINYLHSWRYLREDFIPDDITQMAQTLRSWREQGHPRLVPSQVSEGLERQKHLMSQETEIGGITIPGLIGRPGAEPEAPRGLPRYLFTFEAYAEALERGGVSSSEAGIPSWQRLQWNNVMPIQIPEGRSIKVMNTEGARTFEDAFPSDRRLPFMRGLKRPGFLDPFEQFVKPMQPRTVWERMGLSQEHEHDRIQAAAQLARSLGGDVLIGTNSEVRTSKDALFRQRHGEKTILTPQQLLELEHALLGEQFDLEQGDDISFLRQHLLRKNVLVSVQPGEPQLILRRELQIQQQPK